MKEEKEKQMRKLEKRNEGEKMGGEREKRGEEERKTERAAQGMHRPLWAHSLARS